MQAQAKYIRVTWLYFRGVVGVQVKFTGANKPSSNSKELNVLIQSAMAKALKINKKSKSNTKDDFSSNNELENIDIKENS